MSNDDTGTNAVGLDDKLQKIEERLKQIAGYRFVPPSIKREREELEKQKAALLAGGQAPGAGREEGIGQEQPEVTGWESGVTGLTPNTQQPTANFTPDKSQSASQITDFWADPKKEEAVKTAVAVKPVEIQAKTEESSRVPIFSGTVEKDRANETQTESRSTEALQDKPDDWFNISTASAKGEDGDQDVPDMDLDEDLKKITENKEDKKDDLVGSAYAAPHDGEVIGDSLTDENKGLLAREEGNNKEFELNKTQKAASLDDLTKKVTDLVGACRVVLKREADHNDAEYLEKVVKEFEENIDGMVERAKSMNMNEAWKAKAVQGRLATYIKALKADFEFSDLFDGGIEKAVFDLAGE